MANISFGNMAVDMRRADSDFGIPDLANAQSLLGSFSPVAVNPIDQVGNNYVLLQAYDSYSQIINVGLTGTGLYTSTATLSQMNLTIIGSGFQASISGNVTMTAGAVSGYITQMSLGNLYSGVTYVSISGMNQFVSSPNMYDVLTFENLLAGNDSITAGSSGDYLSGYAGADTVNGGGGNDTINGGNGSDALYGSSGNDKLYGGQGSDSLSGGSGADLISGGVGKDRLTGGTGGDTFSFLSADESGLTSGTRDVIVDFTHGDDRIDLSAIDANSATLTNNAFTRLIGANASFTAAGQLKLSHGVLYANTDADADAEFSIALTGVSSLTLADFVL